MKYKILFTIIFMGSLIWLATSFINSSEKQTNIEPGQSTNFDTIPSPPNDDPLSGARSDFEEVIVNELGESVTINSFKSRGDVTQLAEGQYHLQGSQGENGLPYSILYDETKHVFLIALERLPLKDSRIKASNDFLVLFGIDAKDACKLNVVVGVPYELDSNLAGSDLGLSFCPGSTSL